MKRVQNWQKTLDRVVGIPLVYLCSALLALFQVFRKREIPKEPKSLAVMCVAAIGDLLLLASSIAQFHSRFPNCRIVLFCGPDNASLIPLIDPQKKIFSETHILSPKQSLSAIRVLRRQKFDIVIDSGQWARWSALMAMVIPAKWRIGFKTPNQHRHHLFDQAVFHANSVHELENFQNLFSAWLPKVKKPFVFNRQPSTDASRDFVVCHLFPSGARPHQKEWPAELWKDLFGLLNKAGYSVVLTGGKADRVRLDELFQGQILSGVKDLVGKTSLKETAEILSSAQAVISVNTGIMHLAASLEVPLIALHGPTNPKRWGPVSKSSQVVQSSLGCSPCLNLGFDYGCPRNDCMKNITVSQVLDAFKRVSEKQA